MDGIQQNMAPMRKKWLKNVDLKEPTSFLDHVYLGCTQRECKPNEDIVNVEKCSNHEFLLPQQKITRMEEASPENCRVVLRHGRAFEKVRRQVL